MEIPLAQLYKRAPDTRGRQSSTKRPSNYGYDG